MRRTGYVFAIVVAACAATWAIWGVLAFIMAALGR
jgi:hypothetical protein